MYLIEWTEGPWKNWVDVLPSVEAVIAGKEICALHMCFHQKDGRGVKCACRLKVSTKSISACYDGDDKINKESRVPHGVTRLTFRGNERIDLPKIEWSDDGENFSDASAKLLETDGYGGLEGLPVHYWHVRRERDLSLRRRKIEQACGTARGLSCEACDFRFETKYGAIGQDFCEVHHRRQLKEGERVSIVNDLAVLCSNCHRMIHRTYPMMTVAAFRSECVIAHGGAP